MASRTILSKLWHAKNVDRLCTAALPIALLILVMMLLANGCGSSTKTSEAEMSLPTQNSENADGLAARLFQRVLIIGASVSADIYAPSPGRLVSQDARVPFKRGLSVAKSGAMSSYHTTWISKNLPTYKPTIIFGMDLFEHDVKKSALLTPMTKFRVKTIIDRFCATADQVYIENTVPFGLYLGPKMLNDYLAELQRSHANLYIVDIQGIYAGLYSFGYAYNINGVSLKVTKNQVLVDGVHPNKLGSTLLANVLIQMIRQNNPQVTDKELPYLPVTR